jgi:nitroreductase
MSTLTASDVSTQLNWRYAVKKFDPARRIADQDWTALEQSLVLSPSSFGLQPWRFVVVQDQEIRSQLLPVSWNQRQVVDASHLVVLAARQNLNADDVQRFLQSTSDIRSVPVESLEGYRQMMLGFLSSPQLDVNAWAERQVYLALGTFLTTAAMMGIDTCPMEGIVPAQYDTLLGLTGSGYRTSVAVAAGYRAADDKYASLPKVRFSASELIQRV